MCLLNNKSLIVTTADLTIASLNFKDVYAILLPLAAHWKKIGSLLNIDGNTLDTIEADVRGGDVQECLLSMLRWLYKQAAPEQTKLIDLLAAVRLINPKICQQLKLYIDKVLDTTFV